MANNSIHLEPINVENEKRQALEKSLQLEKEPVLLNEIIYNIFYRVPIALIFSGILFSPSSIFTHASFIILSYIQENLIGILDRISLHLNILYSKPTINDMGFFYYTRYIHYYCNSLILSQYDFMYYCNSLAVAGAFKIKYFNINELLYVLIIPVLIYIIPHNGIFLMLSAATSYSGLTRLSQLSIVGYIMNSCGISNTNIIIYTCYQILQTYLQAITHLWYHTIKSKKLQHFGPILYNTMLSLEDVKIISSEQHKLHHNRLIDNVKDVEVWYDLYVPTVVNDVGTTIFKYIISLNNTNEEKLNTYKIIHSAGNIVVIFIITYISIFLCRFIL